MIPSARDLDEWKLVSGSHCVYITWLLTVPGSLCPPSLVSWASGWEDQYDTNYRHGPGPPGQPALCRIATLACSAGQPAAIKLVFHCQPRHNLPLIINLPHTSHWGLRPGLSPCVACPRQGPTWSRSLGCEMNHCHVWRILKSSDRVLALQLGWSHSTLSWDGPNLWLWPQAGAGLGRGWRLGSGGCSCVRSETRHQEPLVLVRLSCESCELWVRDWELRRQPETTGTWPSPEPVCSSAADTESLTWELESEEWPGSGVISVITVTTEEPPVTLLCSLLGSSGLSIFRPEITRGSVITLIISITCPVSCDATCPLPSSPASPVTTPRAACCWWWWHLVTHDPGCQWPVITSHCLPRPVCHRGFRLPGPRFRLNSAACCCLWMKQNVGLLFEFQ